MNATTARLCIIYLWNIITKTLFERLTKRYGDVTPQALESILCPVLIPIRTIDKNIVKPSGSNHCLSV